MKSAVLVLALLAVATAQERVPYPEGTYCTPRGIVAGGLVVAPDHPCHCQRMDASTDCEAEPAHDQACLQYCSESHCGCPVICVGPTDGTPAPEQEH